MNGKYNIWNKWDPLKTVVLGDCYGADFFRDIKNSKIKSALTRIADETQEDLAYYETVLKDFGCNVLRPELDAKDTILNYIDSDGKVKGNQGVPRSPLQPRDTQLVIGNELFYTGSDHPAIKKTLDKYNESNLDIKGPICESKFVGYRGQHAPNWPTYNEYISNYVAGEPISEFTNINNEFQHIHSIEDKNLYFPVPAPSITVVGKDIYISTKDSFDSTNFLEIPKYYLDSFKKMFNNHRCNTISSGGHSDGSFHTLKDGAILSLREVQHYEDTFPGWDVCYLPDQSWDKVEGFLKLKNKVDGKWWVPEQEHNDEFTYFVETWLRDWVGYVEETVFDVNVLMLDEHHVCVSNLNPTVVKFLKKYNIEPVHVPWRHRYFWDGGLHCITLDLYREGKQQNYFPDRENGIIDNGFD